MPKILLVVLLLAACTKPNPNLCCTDEADCAAAGLAIGAGCEAGLVCRGNQCISQPCAGSDECDASAPYCVSSLCAESCSADMHCPGFGQSDVEIFCVEGGCRQCRVDMNDCAASLPICDEGVCRGCKSNAECQSGACASDGRCVDEALIAYVDSSGSTTSDCTQASPCTAITRALMFSRPYIIIGPGTYSSSSALVLSGQRHLIGASTPPVLTRSTPGPIVELGSGQVGLENLQISGATRGSNAVGEGVSCVASGGAPTLTLRRVLVTDNADSGLHTTSCTVVATESTFTNNGRGFDGSGIYIVSGTGTIDRCIVANNERGLELDSGLYQITNSFIVRNDSPGTSFGINLYTTESGNKIEFNTIADNGLSAAVGGGINCDLSGVTGSFPNNIIVRNKLQTRGASCTYPGSIIADADITAIKFKSPDASPYDYHIAVGSSAIDAATQSSNDHDFDGEPRAAPRDVGADEYLP